MSTFKPTLREIREVQRLARESEIDAGATSRLGPHWYGVHRPAERSAAAFALSAKVQARAQAGVA